MTIIDRTPVIPPEIPRKPAPKKPKKSAAPQINFRAGALAEQHHMVFDLDADSKYPVPQVMRNEVSA